MKKTRKQKKLEKEKLQQKRERYKKNQRRLKELERQNKKTVSDFTPIKIDGTGNITRLINKKGSVPSTETKMYGCEIEKSVPQYIRRFVDKMGFDEMIRVPIQTKGMTGSGKPNECHSNVLGIVKWKKGKILRGYFVCIYNNGVVTMNNHSVWISPEGRCKDITNNYDDRDGMDENCIIRKGDKEYILFVPVSLGLIDELGIGVNEVSFRSDWETYGKFIISRNDDFLLLRKSNFDKFQKKCGFVEKRKYKPHTKSIKWMKDWVDEDSGFSHKSLGTGKSWDELKREIVW